MCQVWEVASGLVILELGVKSVNKEFWPLLQWAHGDELLYHSVTNTVHQYSRATSFKGGCHQQQLYISSKATLS